MSFEIPAIQFIIFWQCTVLKYMLFLITNTFINKTRLKLAKTQAKAKQHPEAEL